MKLSVTGIEYTVKKLFRRYSNGHRGVRVTAERIIDDFEEIIELSKVCEFVVYKTLYQIIFEIHLSAIYKQMHLSDLPAEHISVYHKGLFKLKGDDYEEIEDLYTELKNIVNEIRSELTSEDFRNIDNDLVIIDGPSDQDSNVFVCT